MGLIHTIVAFLVAILILVSLHELGHLIVARLCGIKVLRFSVGFGKPFFLRRWRNIEWCLAPIPLGGYVRMVDTREGKVTEEDLPYAFDKQHPAKRIAVVVAGPLTNLLLAALLYALSFSLYGVNETRPMVGSVAQNSPAQQAGFVAGDTIRQINGVAVDNWGDAQAQIILQLDAGPVKILVDNAEGKLEERLLNIAGTPEAEKVARQGGYLGLSPVRVLPTLSLIVPDSAAAAADLAKGDTIVGLDGQPIKSWQEVGAYIYQHPQDKIEVAYLRNGQKHTTSLRPHSQEASDGTLYGVAGFAGSIDEAWEAKVTRHYQPSIGQALFLGAARVYDYSALTLKLFGRLFTGQASLSHISGPLTIADYAGKTAAAGWEAYLQFLAVVSVSLGILNLMPVPVLDGGHLLYYALEWIRGKPISERVQMMGLRLGITLMLMLMALAFFNDFSRIFG